LLRKALIKGTKIVSLRFYYIEQSILKVLYLSITYKTTEVAYTTPVVRDAVCISKGCSENLR